MEMTVGYKMNERVQFVPLVDDEGQSTGTSE
jgi:hypothetical protein